MKNIDKGKKNKPVYICDFCDEKAKNKKELEFHKLVCKERPPLKENKLNKSFKKWLFTSFITFRLSSNSREIKLFPKWLILTISSLSYASKFITVESF